MFLHKDIQLLTFLFLRLLVKEGGGGAAATMPKQNFKILLYILNVYI